VAADTNSPVRPGDSVYVGAGTYRAVVTQGATWSPAFNGVVNIVGDVTGQFTGDAGMVQLTAYTTNDKTAPSATTLLNLNGKSNLAFSNIMFVGGSATVVTATAATSQNITFRDCAFVSGTQATNGIAATASYAVALNWIIDRCFFGPTRGTSLIFTVTTGVGPNDYDITTTVSNCTFLGCGQSRTIIVTNSGAAAQKGNGLRVRNVFAVGSAANFLDTTTSTSLVFPTSVYNSMFMGSGTGTGLSTGAPGSLVEDYNVILFSTARSGVTVGAHSISDGSYAPLFHFGQERIWGGLLRPFGEPMAGSPLLGFGNDGGQTAYDLYNRPRPAGGGALPYPAVGALERGNTAVQGS
jgi:hypothetical protein